MNNEISDRDFKYRLPLFIGAFVDVTIPGKQLINVFKIPAKALRDKDTVWIAKNKELHIRNVKIAHLDLDSVYLSGGVKKGEKVIISPLKGASNGLKIRITRKNNDTIKKTEK